MYYDYQSYLYALEGRIRQLEDRLLLAEAEAREVKEQLRQMKPIHIDHINYKVQELSVQDLSGTLNIGLTALSEPGQLEQLLMQKDENNNEEEIHLNHLSQTVEQGDL